jgi:hypothetical protein
MAPTRRLRVLGACLALFTGLSVLLQFARATYFGMFFGLLFVGAFWMSRRSGTAASRRVAVSIAVLALLAGAATVNGSKSSDVASPTFQGDAPTTVAIAARVSSGLKDLTTQSGTVGYRYKVDLEMLDLLDGDWPIGLGFWHPDAKPVANLPDHSIRNGDVGALNSLMTMGAIGTVLLFLGPLGVLIAVLATRGRAGVRRDDWFFFGVAAWLVAVLIGSISLVTLFSTSGLVLTAAVLGATIHLLVLERQPEN